MHIKQHFENKNKIEKTKEFEQMIRKWHGINLVPIRQTTVLTNPVITQNPYLYNQKMN